MKLELSEIFQKDIDQAQETFNSLNQLTPMVMYLLAVCIPSEHMGPKRVNY